MAKVKAKTKFNFRKLKKLVDQSRDDLGEVLIKSITREIEGGRSPVAKKGRFQRYSESYREQIRKGALADRRKRRSPVNLKVTGELLKSIFWKQSRKGIRVGFDNPLADIHNRLGASKKKVIRRMLPTNKGETFSKSILNDLRKFNDKLRSRLSKI